MRSGVVLLAALCLIYALAVPAQAGSLQQRDANTEWQIANDCTRKAFKAFPDYTPAGNAQRENYRRACLRSKGLPSPDGAAVQVN
ncbi:MAG TPA: hypothetical protein VMQ63_00515 [Stellaceae bacterium]|jgi:hypothetical protein|nr:hypothetical protein [Stellaceae bacterium]